MGNTVLIVDDDAVIRSAIATILADAGYATREADSGAEALRSVRLDPPERHPRKLLQDARLERRRAQVDRHVELAASAGEVFLELPLERIEAARHAQHAHAERLGELVQVRLNQPDKTTQKTLPVSVAVFDPAHTLPAPIRPKPALYLGVATVLGMALGLVATLFLAQLNRPGATPLRLEARAR